MKLHKFGSYKEYIDAQVKGSKSHGNILFNDRQIFRIAQYILANKPRRHFPINGICHGARQGLEVELFLDQYPQANIIGTDLAPQKECVIEWDFQQQKPEWVEHFDFVYSNSLDHSNEPEKCISIWLDQLTQGGFLFLMWSPLYTLARAAVPHRGGDCFGASLDEYMQIFDKIGIVRDLIYCYRNKWGANIIVVVQRRQ